MIVCLCNGHNDREIRAKAAELGSTCPVAIYSALEGPPRCGRCLDYAGRMLATCQQRIPTDSGTGETPGKASPGVHAPDGRFAPTAEDGRAALA